MAAHFDSFNVPIFFFALSRFHDIFEEEKRRKDSRVGRKGKWENKEERERVFFFIIFKNLNCKFLFIHKFHMHAD